jgi:hypothetical protein
MTCGEFLKALQEHPDAELIFKKMMGPNTGNGRLCQQLDDLTLCVSEHNVIITHDPFKYMN